MALSMQFLLLLSWLLLVKQIFSLVAWLVDVFSVSNTVNDSSF